MFMPRLLLAAVMLLPTAAFADDFTVYQVQGLLQNGYALGGTATLDTTSGVFTASSLAITSSTYTVFTFDYGANSALISDPSLPGSYHLYFSSYPSGSMPTTGFAFLYAGLVMPPSPGQTLQLCSLTVSCAAGDQDPVTAATFLLNFTGMFGQYAHLDYLSSGQFTPLPAATATPEPSSLLLLGTGLVAMGAVFRRRLFS